MLDGVDRDIAAGIVRRVLLSGERYFDASESASGFHVVESSRSLFVLDVELSVELTRRAVTDLCLHTTGADWHEVAIGIQPLPLLGVRGRVAQVARLARSRTRCPTDPIDQAVTRRR